MEFIYPSFLWALGALVVPIIIHLFFFRRFKKVYFTNVKFLKELKEETSNRNKLKNLLILLSRLLALACLVLAFAQPFIPSKNGYSDATNAVSIFIDNSFSMESLSEDVPLIDKAKKKARDIIEAYASEDKFQIITHDFEGRHQRLVSKEDALNLVEEVVISPEVKNLSQVQNKQEQVFLQASDARHSAYIISDFQNIITDLNREPDSTINYNLLPFQSVQENNISIDTAYFLSPVPILNQTNKLIIRVKNHGELDVDNVRISLLQNEQVKPVGTINIDAGKSLMDTVNVSITKPGVQNLELQITDYPIQFDDKYKLSFNVPDKVHVLAIHNQGSNKYLNALFSGLQYFELNNQNINSIKYSEFPKNNLIILSDLSSISSGLSNELLAYMKSGGNVIVFPPRGANKGAYNAFLNNAAANSLVNWEESERAVEKLNTKEFVFQDVYRRLDKNLKLPKTSGNYTFTEFANKPSTGIMHYRDGSKYLSRYRVENGNLYVCASSLSRDKNELVSNAEVFVPLLYKAALFTGSNMKHAYVIGKDELIEVKNRERGDDLVYKIEGKQEFIPGQNNLGNSTIIDINNMIKEEGIYQLSFENEVLESFAFNYDRKESALQYYSIDELDKMYGSVYNIYDNVMEANFSDIVEQREKGVHYWKWCLIFALIFLLIESLLIRFWKS